MGFPLSRLMSAATASHGVYALASPRHLGNALTTEPVEQAGYDVLARTYGTRDLTVSKVLGVTLGWAALNLAALVTDRRRAG